MAFSTKFFFLAMFLVFLPTISFAEDPFTPLYDAVCNEVECGKGKCVGNILKPLGYVCECDSGWARSSDEDVNDNLQFKPCVIPKCSLTYNGCQPAPPPAPEKEVPMNSSFYDPCYWMYCGEGKCTRNSTYNHLCTCNSGFSNLLDIPYFPCYSPCTIGSDCANLGIKVADSKTSPSSSGGNPANSILPWKLQWMIILLASVLMVLQKWYQI